MKKIFTIGLAVAFIAGTTGAFAKQVITAPKANENVYNWVRTGGEALPEEEYPFTGTKSQAEDNFGCRGTIDECAVGTSSLPGVPPAVIYQH